VSQGGLASAAARSAAPAGPWRSVREAKVAWLSSSGAGSEEAATVRGAGFAAERARTSWAGLETMAPEKLRPSAGLARPLAREVARLGRNVA